jgi:hypothetical protein
MRSSSLLKTQHSKRNCFFNSSLRFCLFFYLIKKTTSARAKQTTNLLFSDVNENISLIESQVLF